MVSNSPENMLHISSLVVHFLREYWPSIHSYLSALVAADIPLCDTDEGKCVVVIERKSLRATESTMDAIKAQPGVIAVTLVYHHSEPESELAAPLVANA